MKRIFTTLFIFIFSLIMFNACGKGFKGTVNQGANSMSSIDNKVTDKVISDLVNKLGESNKFRIERGVRQCAEFWRDEDGSSDDFVKFCNDNFLPEGEQLDLLFNRISLNFESIKGHINKIILDFNRPLHLDIGPLQPIDQLFGGYDPSAHLRDDFFKNKIAFHILLNFPYYTLDEKLQKGSTWTRKQWAYVRMGDFINSRVPGDLQLKLSEAVTKSETYISEYNIYVGYLTDGSGKEFFKKDMKLLSHWNLRDEIKAQYGQADGLDKQKIIYETMKRIISQEIPEKFISSNKFTYNPYTDKLFEEGKEITFTPEPNTRYAMILNNFKAEKAIDSYSPYYKDFISRKFDQEYEIPQAQCEELFTKLCSSPIIRQVGALISKRLGRKLEPFDIWYDGFKARSSFPNEQLDGITKNKFKDASDFKKFIPSVLLNAGFTPSKAEFIASKIEVDPARGSGHAWGAEMRSENAHLRTRISKEGLDYKGFNIAMHELGHNIEQTITLQDVDYYMLHSVPNTAFTEAWAFVYQGRDLQMLGLKDNNPDKEYLKTLDAIWNVYEIMGVSLVDMNVWKWLYNNPNATPEELKKAVITIAKDIWNKYYADVFGVKDQTLLAIYSHMVNDPLYLSAYPIGYLIEFQIQKQVEGKVLADEMQRMLTAGSITPQAWTKNAFGTELSDDPILEAAQAAVKHFE